MSFHQALALAAACLCTLAPGISQALVRLPDDTKAERPEEGADEVAAASAWIESLGFQEPEVTEQTGPLMNYLYPQVDTANVVPQDLKTAALNYFNANRDKFANQNYVTVIDFGAHSTQPRLFVMNMSGGTVMAIQVAHGAGSDANNDGIAESFSNSDGSHASSLGFYRTGETYSGNNGYSLRLDGLSPTNSAARARAIVVHGADYVRDNPNYQPGRSWGCPAVSQANRTRLIDMIKGGSLIYAAK